MSITLGVLEKSLPVLGTYLFLPICTMPCAKPTGRTLLQRSYAPSPRRRRKISPDVSSLPFLVVSFFRWLVCHTLFTCVAHCLFVYHSASPRPDGLFISLCKKIVRVVVCHMPFTFGFFPYFIEVKNPNKKFILGCLSLFCLFYCHTL